MVEAKQAKLKEYFTDVTHHNHITPSDQSGKKLFVGNFRTLSSQRKESPIRLNDTYRSNVHLGPALDGPRQEVKPATTIKIGGRVNDYYTREDSRRSSILPEEQGQQAAAGKLTRSHSMISNAIIDQ